MMKINIERGLWLTLDALPDVLDLAPSSSYRILRPAAKSPKVRSDEAWTRSNEQLKKTINEFGSTHRKAIVARNR
ncbi:hypothetical protein [Paraburkholderia bryophila]|nr:hypothetical protein [Paraburkholderia bryophila]